VSLDKLIPEFQGRVKLRERAFPLEVFGNEPPNREQLEVEKWLAALQEPLAEFHPYEADDYPTTTLPTFDAAWCAFQQGYQLGHDYDLRIRKAFFAQGRNIAKREVLIEIATEAGLDLRYFTQLMDSGSARGFVLEEGQLGHNRYRVHDTPTLMLADGTKLRHPIAYPNMVGSKITRVGTMPCHGEGCLDITRNFFEKALHTVTVSH
jgi:predicted DsbA family dithiol-disulfide isomerase